MKQLFSAASLDIAWQLFKKAGSAVSFAEEEESLGLAERLAEAGLDAGEVEALEATLGDGPAAFADDDAMSAASLKLARAGLKLYAGVQRRLAGTVGDEYFRLDPDEAEWSDAQRLAKKFGAGAVVIGHTHAARFQAAEGLVFANTGTWIWLMQLPRADAGDEAWAEFLDELRQNPRLLLEKQRAAKTIQRFTAVVLDEHPDGGAVERLVHWDEGRLHTLASARVPPASPGR